MRTNVLAALAVLSATGCATIFTGTTDTLTFDANVAGVRLSIDGQYMGEMPLTLPMSRNFVGGRQFMAKFEKAGYVTQEFRLTREFNAVAILDVTSIPTSGGIDVLTGSLLKFSPTGYHVQMLNEGRSAASPEFQRSTGLYEYVLMSYRSIQKDIARGGGESLSTFAAALCDGQREAIELISHESLHNAPLLLDAASGHDFIQRFDRMLADSPPLSRYRI